MPEIAQRDRSALDVVPDDAIKRLLGDEPPLVRQIAMAESKLRELFYRADARYEELERVAVLPPLDGGEGHSRRASGGRTTCGRTSPSSRGWGPDPRAAVTTPRR